MSTVAVVSDGPVVAGRLYLVPCVWYPWIGRRDWWPVIGPRHTDKAFLGFRHPHYHVNGRFLTRRQRAFALKAATPWAGSLAELLASRPLSTRGEADPPATPTVKRRRCASAHIAYGAHHQRPIRDLAAHYAGRQCQAVEHGWICPHQRTPLGSIAPVDGVVTCPLHGLRIDAATGVVLAPGGTP